MRTQEACLLQRPSMACDLKAVTRKKVEIFWVRRGRGLRTPLHTERPGRKPKCDRQISFPASCNQCDAAFETHWYPNPAEAASSLFCQTKHYAIVHIENVNLSTVCPALPEKQKACTVQHISCQLFKQKYSFCIAGMTSP